MEGTMHVISLTIIAVTIVGSVTVLGLQGTLDASAVTGILGAVVGIAGGATGTKVGADIVRNGNGVKKT